MIAIDTSSLRRLLQGESGHDVDALRDAIDGEGVALPPVVLSEVLSDPSLAPAVAADISDLPLLEVSAGFWERAGLLRARLIKAGHKAKLADVLIAQSCIDHGMALITNDRDFRHFTRFGLRIA